jgi:hypothetical protein
MPDAGNVSLDYIQRRRGNRRNHSLLFVSIGAINVVLSTLILFLIALDLPYLLKQTMQRGIIWMLAPWIQFAFIAATESMGVVAAVGALMAKHFARGLMAAASVGQIAYLMLLFFYMLTTGELSVTVSWLGEVIVVLFALRGLWAWFTLWASRNARADLYFKSVNPSSLAALTTGNGLSGNPADPIAPSNRFHLRGRNKETGETLDYISKAPTQDIARKSAIALGIDAETLRIEELSDG